MQITLLNEDQATYRPQHTSPKGVSLLPPRKPMWTACVTGAAVHLECKKIAPMTRP